MNVKASWNSKHPACVSPR